MNKKVLVIAVALMVVAMLAVPVMADPTQGQKASITITWIPTGTEIIEETISGIVIHRHVHASWDVVLAIDGGPTFYGTAFDDRDVTMVPQEDGLNLVLRGYYELSFPDEGGGFEGNALIIMDGFTGPGTWERGRAHGLFRGTGAFEGQTINAGHDWEAPAGPPVWTGYLLKP